MEVVAVSEEAPKGRFNGSGDMEREREGK